jgi:tRNA(fMet)-specific endonuclease VapC
VYLLDTNIIIHAGEGHDVVLQKLVENAGKVCMSALNLAELQRGVFKYPDQTALRLTRLTTLLSVIPVIPFDQEAAESYGKIIAHRGWVRSRDTDRMIAAHAISAKAILVTNNTADFKDIPGLTLENWAT